MRDLFNNVLNDYQEAYGQPFADHPVGKLLRQILPNTIKNVIPEKERYLIKGSSGNGNWAETPWIAILDILITNTPQSGYYPVFLFKNDMTGFYLSLNQGVTEVREKYKSDTKKVLQLKAQDFRAQIGVTPKNFNKIEIELKRSKGKGSSNAALYEAGNIIAKYYSSFKLPSNEDLKVDILEILKIYELISYNEGLPTTQAEKETDEDKYKGFENLKKYRFHKRIERNIRLSKKVKEAQGYNCKACGVNFVTKYGKLGANFIEAHHLKPIHQLTGDKIKLDARIDFTVLCSNCHSMIHRLDDPSDLEALKQLIIQ